MAEVARRPPGQRRSREAVATAAVDERLSDECRREDLYLSALVYYVEALGGQLEVRAQFGEEAVVVRREPHRPGAADS